MKTIEEEIFKKYSTNTDDVPILFIIASPRTGSTLFYQLMIKLFNLSYFSNFVEQNMPQTPIIGTLLEQSLINDQNNYVTLENFYGETSLMYEPTEASMILNNWFEYLHPSESNAKNLKMGVKEHFENTMSSMYSITKKPIIIKDAWNGYRVEELSKVFKNSYFIWLRRDIVNSSYSDLIARKRKGNPQNTWSSATPDTYKDIQKLHPAQQVVEAQYIYNTKVKESFQKHLNKENFTEIWYEDLESNMRKTFNKLKLNIENNLNIKININKDLLSNLKIQCSKPKVKDKEYEIISSYANSKYPFFINQ